MMIFANLRVYQVSLYSEVAFHYRTQPGRLVGYSAGCERCAKAQVAGMASVGPNQGDRLVDGRRPGLALPRRSRPRLAQLQSRLTIGLEAEVYRVQCSRSR